VTYSVQTFPESELHWNSRTSKPSNFIYCNSQSPFCLQVGNNITLYFYGIEANLKQSSSNTTNTGLWISLCHTLWLLTQHYWYINQNWQLW